MPSAPVVRPGTARRVASWLPPVASFPPGRSFLYELAFDGDAETPKPQLIGLIDVDRLKQEGMTANTSIGKVTSSRKVEASSPQRAPIEPGTRNGKSPLSDSGSVSCAKPQEDAPNRKAPLKILAVS